MIVLETVVACTRIWAVIVVAVSMRAPLWIVTLIQVNWNVKRNSSSWLQSTSWLSANSPQPVSLWGTYPSKHAHSKDPSVLTHRDVWVSQSWSSQPHSSRSKSHFWSSRFKTYPELFSHTQRLSAEQVPWTQSESVEHASTANNWHDLKWNLRNCRCDLMKTYLRCSRIEFVPQGSIASQWCR